MATIVTRFVWSVALVAAIMGTAVTSVPHVSTVSDAPSVRIEPAQGIFFAGQDISFSVTLAAAQSINAIEGVIHAGPGGIVRVASKNDSLIGIWLSEPSILSDAATLRFSGGIPSPGFSGTGTLARGIAQATHAGKFSIAPRDVHVYVNDGMGTEVVPMIEAADYIILDQNMQSPDVTGDGIIDDRDMRLLVSAWGRRGASRFDLNNDERVDVVDLGIVLSVMRHEDSDLAPRPDTRIERMFRALAGFLFL